MKLTVLSRGYCHLCDDMIAALKVFQSRNQLQFDIEVVDVDLDAALESRYGDKVPVLLHGDSEICHYFLDEARLAAHLLSPA
jgi:hypothetical protein